MFKSTKEFDVAMKDILIQFRDGKTISTLSPLGNEDDFLAALCECVDRRFLSGLTYQCTLDGKPHFTEGDVRVTYSGISFIESH